jgi:hypothetical protein
MGPSHTILTFDTIKVQKINNLLEPCSLLLVHFLLSFQTTLSLLLAASVVVYSILEENMDPNHNVLTFNMTSINQNDVVLDPYSESTISKSLFYL